LLSLIAVSATAMAAPAKKPTVSFTGTPTSGYVPLSVQFTSKTTGNQTSYTWIFESQSSSDWNSHHAVTAVHTFTKPSVYTISLIVSNKAGTTTATKTSYITVRAKPRIIPPVANFYCNTGYISYLPYVVRFTDTSSGSVSRYYWDFGDGTSSTAKNPVHRYYDWPVNDPSFYVTETVSNSAGSSYAYTSIDTAYYYENDYGLGAKLHNK